MHVLALDTTTREGSVALVDDARVIDERRSDPARPHAERLPLEIVDLLTAHRLRVADVEVFAVAAGPGSFTGMRIGMATIQGLALTVKRPVVAASALDVLAQMGSIDRPAGSLVAAWIDGRRQEVFAALYVVESAPVYHPGRLTVLDGPVVGPPAAILGLWASAADGPVTFIGDGAVLYEAAIRARGQSNDRVLSPPLLAGAMGQMAVIRAALGEVSHPAAVQPLYVRRPDVEVARDRLR